MSMMETDFVEQDHENVEASAKAAALPMNKRQDIAPFPSLGFSTKMTGGSADKAVYALPLETESTKRKRDDRNTLVTGQSARASSHRDARAERAKRWHCSRPGCVGRKFARNL